MSDQSTVKTSKLLSLVLRHRPEAIGIEVDPHGWASVEEIIAGARRQGTSIDRESIARAVRENDKQRFTLSDDGNRIRANQGHSIKVDLELAPLEPPPQVFHGTVARFLDSIRQQGLVPGTRQHVHLSADEKTALIVGSRRGKPIVLEVDSGAMSRDGLPFYRSANGVWLTDFVPARYLTFPL
ncbi:unnamed protein product [Cladocopium goreaui]|uniref:2'-phosphotransferase n=1 Tax=Cladocopium goreaui TaxID=2562237 RepID=A0A9P1DLZ6_9DINO|nr:unnamed protein product [Cladocopium goreaui]